MKTIFIFLALIAMANASEISVSGSNGVESYSEDITLNALDSEFYLSADITPGGIWSSGHLDMTTGTFGYRSNKDIKSIKSNNVKTSADLLDSSVVTVTAGGVDITPRSVGRIGEIKQAAFVDAYASAADFPTDFNDDCVGNGLPLLLAGQHYLNGGLQYYWNNQNTPSNIPNAKDLFSYEEIKWNHLHNAHVFRTEGGIESEYWETKRFFKLPTLDTTSVINQRDGQNTVGFASIPENSAAVGYNTIWFMTPTDPGNANYLVESDIRFNPVYFNTIGDQYSLPTVAMHELGHSLGFGDVNNIDEIMHWLSYPGESVNSPAPSSPGFYTTVGFYNKYDNYPHNLGWVTSTGYSQVP